MSSNLVMELVSDFDVDFVMEMNLDIIVFLGFAYILHGFWSKHVGNPNKSLIRMVFHPLPFNNQFKLLA